MKPFTKILVAGAGALALTATTASAEIVCNGDGDCWHAKEHVEYKPELKIQVHPDNWKWASSEHHKWHEHEGRGYWNNGLWVDIR